LICSVMTRLTLRPKMQVFGHLNTTYHVDVLHTTRTFMGGFRIPIVGSHDATVSCSTMCACLAHICESMRSILFYEFAAVGMDAL
jgi:hypothetical protein